MADYRYIQSESFVFTGDLDKFLEFIKNEDTRQEVNELIKQRWAESDNVEDGITA